MHAPDRKQVVIVGAGFGGLTTAQSLAKADVDITVVDRRNFHLFQPLLYQVATAGLNPSDIAWPVRSVLRNQANARVLLGAVGAVDTAAREVIINDGRRLPYDYLVLATGATHTYFGHDEWAPIAPGLKRIDDATLIRRRLLLAFERAENTDDAALRRALTTFVIVGGGPTGVEMAGAIAELAQHALAADFRSIDPRDTRIILVEGASRLLGAFPESLSEVARRDLQRMSVDVRLNAQVIGCDAQGVTLQKDRIDAHTIVWAAGVAASPAARWVGCAADRAGRALVGADLSVPGHAEIFVIGDTASVKAADGAPVPGVAPAAKQAGQHVAACIRAETEGKPRPAAFRYRNFGNLATIGRNSAVIHYGRLKLSGRLAWWLWSFAHIYFLIGMRNRTLVAIQWFWNYLSYGRGARLIVGSDTRPPGAP
ncbi:MAG: dehydrogenase protein [Hydrocarboniphaga sp.]|uniref:NAD(P)/FAD-dependent oxidoreductase n=1 Tax=Hydrocarboniphaga sp. TaxID=2033016 RepID=UPI002610AFC7|nr:NAD(P)/FAD-dependent oxidoreductase [Hydrocarboniphaga sp.]MDB5969741.1 dehydrogenase protein [Hydrocarboniphaga sp.]